MLPNIPAAVKGLKIRSFFALSPRGI